MSPTSTSRPTIRLLPGHDKRAAFGHPWVYSNEIAMDVAAKALTPGSLVALATASGKALGVATFNPHTLVAARILQRDPAARIDRDFFAARLERALALRHRLYPEPYYRLIHAEADGLPGIVLDRFGDVLSCQINTAGMALLQEEFLAACHAVLAPRAIVLRNDTAARVLEGLAGEDRVAFGEIAPPVEIVENGARFAIDPLGGQKTGWFYDQRENRRLASRFAAGARVLDLYCFGGGFGILAALSGADQVLAVDRSEAALALAATSAALNGVAARCRFARGDAFDELERLHGQGERFDLVIADPPAFARAKKDLGPALRGYRKLARMSAALVAKGGALLVASCSHQVETDAFAEAVSRGLADAQREGRIVASTGAAPDHPVHPLLPESAYLKAQMLVLD
ncbi:MAG TPA: class I SAM-dependent rRNA methyltransferase [Stellaceae bacterium]|nr:class I SAM-dependent rRNA methyltransferase [Stellaceae bacterium]